MNAVFKAPPDMRFECRDCPARCCRMPWAIRMSAEEAARYQDNDWARARLRAAGAALSRDRSGHFVLPMIEVERRLQCVFLDDDGLCGLQKQFGHAFIPAVCQAFPFEFVRDESGTVRPVLSHLCPSIRDNRGGPVSDRLEEKLAQAGGVHFEMPTSLSLGGGTLIGASGIAMLTDRWEEKLASSDSVPHALADIYDETVLLRTALAREGAPRVPAGEDIFGRSLTAAIQSHTHQPLPKSNDVPPIANVLFALCLSIIAYPARVAMPHRVRRRGERAPSLLDTLSTKLSFVLGRGEADLLLIEKPFPLERVSRVARFLSDDAAAPVRSFLRQVVARRGLFAGCQDITEAVFALGFGASLISRFARCAAAAEGLYRCEDRHIREGISAAELLVFTHARLLSGSALTRLILRGLAANRLSYRNVLIAEA